MAIIFAANKKHCAILRRGVEAWNKWREKNPDVRPNLLGTDLSEGDLSRANFSTTILADANFSGTNLSGAGLYGANLSRAHLNGANLQSAI
jgi:uncharacterized protein YjbI with pentapeptide repeats